MASETLASTRAEQPTDGLPSPVPHPLHAALDAGRVAHLIQRVVASPRAQRTTTTAPFTGLPLVTLPTSTEDDVQQAVEAARRAQPHWAQVPVRQRAGVLLRLHDLVLEHQG